MTKINVSPLPINQTITHLRAGGESNCETVVLWLGKGNDVQEVFRPEQSADVDFFRIPSHSMRGLIAHLRSHKSRILAQIHSHPEEAFHSTADDFWAIVRHEGALSLLLPRFARSTETESFINDVAIYQLTADDKWVAVDAADHVVVTGQDI